MPLNFVHAPPSYLEGQIQLERLIKVSLIAFLVFELFPHYHISFYTNSYVSLPCVTLVPCTLINV